jgi:AmmeMemoRadiSam system protein A
MEKLNRNEKLTLLRLAREALESSVHGKALPPVVQSELTIPLQEDGASFVTLTINGKLRGCIGALTPYQPLYQDVREHSVAAALQDYRFSPVRPSELSHILVEVSRLTTPQALIYQHPADLLASLQPGRDGVILIDGSRRATFLPQVWAQIPVKEEFLGHLCAKMGAPTNFWKQKHIDVQLYQVEEFNELDQAPES